MGKYLLVYRSKNGEWEHDLGGPQPHHFLTSTSPNDPLFTETAHRLRELWGETEFAVQDFSTGNIEKTI